MKKITGLFIYAMLLIGLIACQVVLPEENDYSDEIRAISTTINETLPEILSSDYEFPSYDPFNVTYMLNDMTYEEGDRYTYHPSYQDEEVIMQYTISRENTTLTFDHHVRVLSGTTAEHQSSLYIHIDGDVEDINRDDYIAMETSLMTNVNGQMDLIESNVVGRIRGRGHSTWYTYPKKPYKLKFDEKISLLGLPKAKEYVLLAEYADKSLLRNVLTHELSKQLSGIEHALETRYVDLYINLEYRGLYVLTEQVEIKENKLDFDIDFNTNNLSFFIEYDNRYYADDNPDTDPRQWTFYNGIAYNIKEPDYEDEAFTPTFNEAIASYLKDVSDSIKNADNIDDISVYVDIDNWIDYFLLQEITKNVDVGYSSVYLYKKKDSEQLKFGPLWDFDFAYGNADYIDYSPEGFYGLRSDKNYWYHLIMEIPEVRLRYQERALEILPTLKTVADKIMTDVSQSMLNRVNENFILWPTLDIYIWPNPTEVVAANTYIKQIEYLKNYVDSRIDWLLETVSSTAFENGEFVI